MIQYITDTKEFNMEIKSDLLTESEKKLFIEKMLTHYHERNAKGFSETFEQSSEETLKLIIARINDGFAVLDLYGNIMTPGRFYVLKNSNFYRVGTTTKDSKSCDSATYVTTIQVNGFEKVTDENIRSNFEEINQFFALQAWNDALGIKP
jgi:hypothetical protein